MRASRVYMNVYVCVRALERLCMTSFDMKSGVLNRHSASTRDSPTQKEIRDAKRPVLFHTLRWVCQLQERSSTLRSLYISCTPTRNIAPLVSSLAVIACAGKYARRFKDGCT